MLNPFEPTTEIDGKAKPPSDDEQSTLSIIAAVLLGYFSLYFLLTGSVIASSQLFLLSLVCWGFGKKR